MRFASRSIERLAASRDTAYGPHRNGLRCFRSSPLRWLMLPTSGGAVNHEIRLGRYVGDEIAEGPVSALGRDHQDIRDRTQRDHSSEISCRIIRQVFVTDGRDGVRDRVHHQRMAVRIAFRNDGRADRAACTGPIFDDDRLSKLERQLVTDRLGDDVRRPARRKWHDRAKRLCRPVGGAYQGRHTDCGRRSNLQRVTAWVIMTSSLTLCFSAGTALIACRCNQFIK